MEQELYQRYFEYLQQASQYKDWMRQSGGLLADLYPRDSSPHARALKVLGSLVGQRLQAYVDGEVDDPMMAYEDTVQEVNDDMSNAARLVFNKQAIRFVVFLYMDFLHIAPSELHVEDLSEYILNANYIGKTLGANEDGPHRMLKYYQGLLRELTKRNRLMHFKSAKDSLKLCYPRMPQIYKNLTSGGISFTNEGGALMKRVLRCQECGEHLIKAYDEKVMAKDKCPNCKNIGTLQVLPEKPIILNDENNFLKCPNPKCSNEEPIFNTWLTQGRCGKLLCSQCKTPILQSSPLIVSKDLSKAKGFGKNSVLCQSNNTFNVLKKLYTQAKNKKRNFGIHSLYLAIGFLNWKDTQGEEYRSPLLLCRAVLALDEKSRRWKLTLDGSEREAVTVNSTLAYRLRGYSEQRRIELPSLEEGDQPLSYLNQVKSLMRNEGLAWSVEEDMVLALFNSPKASLEEELDELKEEYLRHPFINQLCGGALTLSSPTESTNILPSVGEYSICDADSSQEAIIEAAISGESFVLQGPPGTGKSQTITNIISEMIARGKTVLFVTQKATARAIICDNMRARDCDGISLMDYCLNFDEIIKEGSSSIATTTFLDHLEEKSAKEVSVHVRDNQQIDFLKDEIEGMKTQLSASINSLTGGVDKASMLSHLMRWMEVANEPDVDFDKGLLRSVEGCELSSLENMIERFYQTVPSGNIDYRKHPLFGLEEANFSSGLFQTIHVALQCFDEINACIRQMNAYSLSVQPPKQIGDIQELARAAQSVATLPIYYKDGLAKCNASTLKKMIAYCEELDKNTKAWRRERDRVYRYRIDRDMVWHVKVSKCRAILQKCSFPLFRLGKEYRECIQDLAHSYKDVPVKVGYHDAQRMLGEIARYQEYCADITPLNRIHETLRFSEEEWNDLMREYGYTGDSSFGTKSDSFLDFDWLELRNYLQQYYDCVQCNNMRFFSKNILDLLAQKDWTFREDLFNAGAGLLQSIDKLKNALDIIKGKLDVTVCDLDAMEFTAVYHTLAQYYKHRDQLNEWIPFVSYYRDVRGEKCVLEVIHTLINANIVDVRHAKGALLKAWWWETLNQRLSKPDFNKLNVFQRNVFESRLNTYAELDRARIKDALKRAYSTLQKEKMQERLALGVGVGRRKKTFSDSDKKDRARDIIKNNWGIISKINPCFMMSPLNVGQYVDPSVKFDLVIFDEASQIFAEDALASIYRGSQVIIVGDQKQLPPSSFFRARAVETEGVGEAEEEHPSRSILSCASRIFNQNDYSLRWHYRSCDESLISFSNHYFYKGELTTFPNAAKLPQDGVWLEYVDYDADGCYVSGQGASHINRNEAERVIACLKQEIKQNKHYSVGIVAFSAEQASFIEEEWQHCREEILSRSASEEITRAELLEWEQIHAKEGLVICNLDSIQGDERDTILISSCYGPDQNEQFNLLMLGPLRMMDGMNRLNVAITRARHRMVVVTSMNSGLLKQSIAKSKGEHNQGAMVLADFFKYVEGFTEMDAPLRNETEAKGLAKRICEILDENNIAYKCNVGESDSKIDIAILGDIQGTYKAGLIFDTSMEKVQSIREYARLRDEIFQKYGWRLYHIWTMAWFRSFKKEKESLLAFLQGC